jgi:hypothetical protein
VHELAVRFIEAQPMTALARIALYHATGVAPALLVPSYAHLVARPSPLSNEEAATLGLPTALAIFRARELARGPGGGASAAVVEDKAALADFVRDTFGLMPEKSPLRDGLNDTHGPYARAPFRVPPSPSSESVDTVFSHTSTVNGA